MSVCLRNLGSEGKPLVHPGIGFVHDNFQYQSQVPQHYVTHHLVH